MQGKGDRQGCQWAPPRQVQSGQGEQGEDRGHGISQTPLSRRTPLTKGIYKTPLIGFQGEGVIGGKKGPDCIFLERLGKGECKPAINIRSYKKSNSHKHII